MTGKNKVPVVAGYTSVGRSGVNLDAFGWTPSCRIAWVLDGVSPIVHEQQFHANAQVFRRATVALTDALETAKWESFSEGIREACQLAMSRFDVRASATNRPMFSAAIVQLVGEQHSRNAHYYIYGDCQIAVDCDGHLTVVSYESLEALKIWLDSIFRIFNRLLCRRPAALLMRTVFRFVRVLQTHGGLWRVLDIACVKDPPIHGQVALRPGSRILMMSDGASWYFKDNHNALRDIMDHIDQEGIDSAVARIRRSEKYNETFGRRDDMTLVYIKV